MVSHYLVPLQSQVGASRLWGGSLSRDVAQLVARHVRDVEVGSSSLLIPTQILLITIHQNNILFCIVPLVIGTFKGKKQIK